LLKEKQHITESMRIFSKGFSLADCRSTDSVRTLKEI